MGVTLEVTEEDGRTTTDILEAQPGATRTTEVDLPGSAGAPGASVYQIWLDNGHSGDQAAFLAAMRGPDGHDAYQTWLDHGHSGTFDDFIDAIYDDTEIRAELALKADAAGLSHVATSGAYADLTGKPFIPAHAADVGADPAGAAAAALDSALGLSAADAASRVNTERLRALQAESVLSGAISGEATRAQSAEQTISGSVTTERNRAQSAESALSGSISSVATSVGAEMTRAQGVESTLSGSISSEATRAQGVESALSGSISSEASRAQQAEAALSGSISGEASRALAAESGLSDLIAAEVARALGVEALKADLVGGVIPTSQIPAIALSTRVPVADQAAMLALTSSQVQPGDVAVRQDGAGTFMLTGTDASQLSSWGLLNAPTDKISSVNGQIGTVVLGYIDVGADAAGAADQALASAQSYTDNAVSSLSTDTTVVHLAGTETITGSKSLANNVPFNGIDSTGTARQLLKVTTGDAVQVGSGSLSTTTVFGSTSVILAPGSVSQLSATTTGLSFRDGYNVVLGSGAGTMIGTAAAQKVGFFGATPVPQQVGSTDLLTALSNLGLITTTTTRTITTTGAVSVGALTAKGATLDLGQGYTSTLTDNTLQFNRTNGNSYIQAGASGGSLNLRLTNTTPGDVTVLAASQNSGVANSIFNGLVGLAGSIPTHTLTLGSTSTGEVHYNTSDQTVNYERNHQYWSGNVFTIANERGGTGGPRTLSLQSQTSGATAKIDITRSALPFFNISDTGTSLAGTLVVFNSNLGGTGTQIAVGITPTIAQTSTGSYTALLVNPTETSVGSGTKKLLDLQVGGTSQVWVTNGGGLNITSTGYLGVGLGAPFGSAKASIATSGNANTGLAIRGNGTTLAVTNAALTGNVATLTTASANGFIAGHRAVVSGVGAPFDGTWILASASGSTFTYAVTSADIASASVAGSVVSDTQTGTLLQLQDGTYNQVAAFTAGGSLTLGVTALPANLIVTGTSTLSGNAVLGSSNTSGTALTIVSNSSGSALQSTRTTSSAGSAVVEIGSSSSATTYERLWQIYVGGGNVSGSGAGTAPHEGTLTIQEAGTDRVRVDRGGVLNALYGLTLPTGATSTWHNQTDQITNYERARAYWNSNIFTIATDLGGTGSQRSIALIANGKTLSINSSISPSGIYNFTGGTAGTNGSLIGVTGGYTQSSGIINFLAIQPTINQSVTAGYTGLLVNPTETTIGSGVRLLADFQVGSSSKLNIDTTGSVVQATGASTAWHNQTDQTTNYERVRAFWSSNVFKLASEAGGTGVTRPIQINNVTVNPGGATGGTLAVFQSTSLASSSLLGLAGTLSAVSGTQYGAVVTPTIQQTVTGGYTALHVNVTETSVGSGLKSLLDMRVGGTSLFNVDNTGTAIYTAARVSTAGSALITGSRLAVGTSGDTNPGIVVRGNGTAATVSNMALTSNVATLTTSAAHGFTAGRRVVVAGVSSTFNGNFTIASVPTTTTFTYAVTAADVASTPITGTATAVTQTAPLLTFLNTLGETVAFINGSDGVPRVSGIFGITSAGATASSAYIALSPTTASVQIVQQTASSTVFSVRGASGQTGDLQQWVDPTGATPFLAVSAAGNFTGNTVGGTKIGTAATQKFGFFNATPIVQPSGTPAAATDLATALTLVNDLRAKLLALGLAA